jgi:molecular chaperone DnaK
MSKEDIEKAVKDAEQFASEDKKTREEAEIRNNADQMVYQTEQALAELGDKVDAAEKESVQKKVDALKEALKGSDYELIKTGMDSLQKQFVSFLKRFIVLQASLRQPVQAPNADKLK